MDIRIKAQKGPQKDFLSTKADIAIYGGAAGGGKTWALLLEPLRHKDVNDFYGVIFRRTTPQITNPGGMWSETQKIYPLVGGTQRYMGLKWSFGDKSEIRFAQLEYEKTVYDWQGAQIAFIGFDELAHFSMEQFFYMLSRNRSLCGIKPYIRATTNPDPDSWVRHFIDWWIDPLTGFPIPERSGKIRFFVRDGDDFIWGNSVNEIKDKAAHIFANKELKDLNVRDLIKSVTFIPASIYDNKALLKSDPRYLANLLSLPQVDREQLLEGKWNARKSAGKFFKRNYFDIISLANVPKIKRSVRFWDLASTQPSTTNPNPDWLVGVRLALADDNNYYILNVVRFRGNARAVESLLKRTADFDGKNVSIVFEQEPGSSGKAYISALANGILKGHIVYGVPSSGTKAVRARLVSAASERRELKMINGVWNNPFILVLQAFPDGKHDDDVDALSGAYNWLIENKGGTDTIRNLGKM